MFAACQFGDHQLALPTKAPQVQDSVAGDGMGWARNYTVLGSMVDRIFTPSLRLMIVFANLQG